MSSKNLHDKPFDEETITKLEIFEDYAQAWLPTFIMQKKPIIRIFDFFAGTGFDKAGVPGSPIRLLKKIAEHRGNIFANRVRICIFLNEFEPNKRVQSKFALLKSACDEFMKGNPGLEHMVQIQYSNEDFETLFPKLLPEIKLGPSLVYLDQNGIKFTSEKYFLELEKASQTDFLYFISSSYFWRFGEQEEFKMNLDIDMVEAKGNPYKFIHVSIINQLRKKLPENTKLKLYPFSLKKGKNLHGIIFGASHIRAVDKFLGVAWARNANNGQANFDIYDEATANQINLFSGDRRRSRVETFQDEVKEKVLSGVIKNNKQLFDFAMHRGFLGTHANQCLKTMKKEGHINYDSTSPMVNYDKTYKKPHLLSYNIKHKESTSY